MLRNFISVTGITPESNLPKEIKGELLQHSDIDYIFIPGSKPKAKEVTHVGIQVEIKDQRIIKAPTGTIVIVDGVKKLKLSYVPLGHSKRNIQLELELPYNTFIELPEGVEKIKGIDLYVADAYFELVEGRKIYSYVFYMLNIDFFNTTTLEAHEEEEPMEETTAKEEGEVPEREEYKENNAPGDALLSELRKALSPYIEDDFEDQENDIKVEDEPDNS
ncbi:hypothetical protein [Clostridium thermarum]|uniref:hypothetical protein n=1 Tax=Clostridium thermarum TaxID=1716543 RepID=UPI0013D84EA8|nr:hypothetical protein [Clostridium thermarum]